MPSEKIGQFFTSNSAAMFKELQISNENLDESQMLYESQERRLQDDDVVIQRIFWLAKKDEDAPVVMAILELFTQLETLFPGKIGMRIIAESGAKQSTLNILKYLHDIVIFDEEVAFVEIPGQQNDHRVISSKSDITADLEKFRRLWAKNSLSVSDYLASKQEQPTNGFSTS